MRQECPLAIVWASYALVALAAFVIALAGEPLVAALVVAWCALAWYAYVRAFPRVSRFIGYGSVVDREPRRARESPVVVRLYVALGCPFSPIVRDRLRALAPRMGFRLEETDVTWRPALVAEKGFRAVPVVEVGGTRIVGHATSEELAQAIAAAAPLVAA